MFDLKHRTIFCDRLQLSVDYFNRSIGTLILRGSSGSLPEVEFTSFFN